MIQVGADKRENLSYEVINLVVIENGTPTVVFMDAPRSRSMYVSSAWLEELKNGVVKSPKYKSKKISLAHVPHAVVMMNEFPKKNPNDPGLSDDRYTYLVIDKEGIHGRWFHEFLDPTTQDAYETIQETVQTRLPNNLQDKLNKAVKSVFETENQEANANTISNTLIAAIKSWSKSPFAKNI